MGVRGWIGVWALVAGLWPLVVAAGDGVLEINQACAMNTGCFPGDAAGFPVTISESGSYRLTSILFPPDIDTSGIEIADFTSEITLDLGGFGIIFPGNGCLNQTICPQGAGDGISGARSGALCVVRDGFVRHAGRNGIHLSATATVEAVRVDGCGGDGIVLGPRSILSRSHVNSCGGNGATLGGNTVFSHSVFAINNRLGGGASDRSGGIPTIGNLCADKSCGSAPQRRRYYLTPDAIPGTDAADSGVCASGFHYASFAELADPSNLEYETTLGRTLADSGSGPPSEAGWARSGGQANTLFNCNAGSGSASGGFTLRIWSFFLTTDAEPASPWIYGNPSCGTPHPVWCIED